jgi:DNA topoisomerase-1
VAGHQAKKLVIVESPAKAKTIGKYLGDGYEVLASVGHVRDLVEPRDLPADMKKGPFGTFAVDVDHGFTPYYAVSPAKKKTVAELKRALKDADELYLATDEDREGEAIAWHLLQVLKPKIPVHRMVFHEITPQAIAQATTRTRDLNDALVDAQETRRILDRLYGYEVSPVLWRKVGPGLSAGRVQSAATRLIVDRERERIAFVAASYSDLVVQARPAAAEHDPLFPARLVSLDGHRLATSRDFTDAGELKGEARILTPEAAAAVQAALQGATVRVDSVDRKPYRRRPAAPFTTSTLQQEAGRKLRYSSRQTMSLAQSLYENGYITYMRTDSSVLSTQAVHAARAEATERYGAASIPEQPRVYSGHSKNAQEAHEAIRPAGESFRAPDSLRTALSPAEFRLYELIWKRTVASQMRDATGYTATMSLQAARPDARLHATGTVIEVRGFLDAYEEGTESAGAAPSSVRLPALQPGDEVTVVTAEAREHQTQPPARYTEASLVKAMEELGIGRPSTYAAIISTIIDRGYVQKKGQTLVPSWVAFSVVHLLEEHFGTLVDYDFTAEMENDLDRIAAGNEDRRHWLTQFFFGDDNHQGLHGTVQNLGEIDAREVNSRRIDEGVTLRIGRYGPYLEATDPETGELKRANLPDDLEPDQLTPERAHEILDAPVAAERNLGTNPDSGRDIVVKDGRYGPYVTEVLPEGETWPKGQKAPTASLFKDMDPATVSLDTARSLLSLPREVGPDPESGTMILALNGRYGPYLKKGTETRSLPSEQAIFDIDVPGAQALFAQPKYGGRRASAPLKDFGQADPTSEKPVVIKDGRFGPYITDGATNVTVPRGEEPAQVTFERAVELLAEKRAKGPAKKRRAPRKTTAKKTTAKKTTARKRAATAKTAATTKTTKKRAPRTTTAQAATAANPASSSAAPEGSAR